MSSNFLLYAIMLISGFKCSQVICTASCSIRERLALLKNGKYIWFYSWSTGYLLYFVADFRLSSIIRGSRDFRLHFRYQWLAYWILPQRFQIRIQLVAFKIFYCWELLTALVVGVVLSEMRENCPGEWQCIEKQSFGRKYSQQMTCFNTIMIKKNNYMNQGTYCAHWCVILWTIIEMEPLNVANSPNFSLNASLEWTLYRHLCHIRH